MGVKPTYPFPCRDCGTAIANESERYQTYRRCRPCGLRAVRERQARVTARKRGEDVPLLKFGPPPTEYPFACTHCGVQVTGPHERGENCLLCRSCRREQKRIAKVRSRYGLTAGEFAQLEVVHQGECGICSQKPARGGLVVDHDHQTGAVRGLLCLQCNWILGHAQDDPARLRSAAAYLERSERE